MFDLAVHRKDGKFATIAAFILVLQVVFSSLVFAAGPSDATLDVFGNPLCITSTDVTGDDPGRNDHSALPDCCTVSCSMFAPATAADRASAALSPLHSIVSAQLRTSFSEYLPKPVLLGGPGSPRAPPFAV